MDIIRVDSLPKRSLLIHDIISQLSLCVLIILQQSNDFLFNQSSLDKLEYQMKVRVLLKQYETETMSFLNQSFATELSLILTYA